VTRDELRELVAGLKFGCGLAAMKPEVRVHDEVSPWDSESRRSQHIVGHLAIKIRVPDRVSGRTVDIHGPCREVTVDDTPATVMKLVRQEFVDFLTHEFDESLLLHDVRIFDPHKDGIVDPRSLLDYALKRGEEKRAQFAAHVSDPGRTRPLLRPPVFVFVDWGEPVEIRPPSPGTQALLDAERFASFKALRRLPDRSAYDDIVETFRPAMPKAEPERAGHVPEQLRAHLARDLPPLDRQRFRKSARKR